MLTWILSKISGPTLIFIGGAALVLALWGGVKYYKAKAKEAEARAVVAEKTLEVKDDQKEREAKVEKFVDDDYLRYWGGKPGVRPDNSKGGPPAPAPKASP